jgi:hypothetical protein
MRLLGWWQTRDLSLDGGIGQRDENGKLWVML